MFNAPLQYQESDLGFYAEKHDVLYEFERLCDSLKEGKEFELHPLVNSRMRDAIFDWNKWKEQHPAASCSDKSLSICSSSSLFPPPSKYKYKENELGFYAQQYGVHSTYLKLVECAETKSGEELKLSPLEDSRLRDAIWKWDEWKERHSGSSENNETAKSAQLMQNKKTTPIEDSGCGCSCVIQ